MTDRRLAKEWQHVPRDALLGEEPDEIIKSVCERAKVQ